MSDLTAAAAALETEDAGAHDPAELQRLLAAAVRAYAALGERGESLAPFAPGAEVTATEACVAASAMLRAVSVEVFELAMFETWAATRGAEARE